MNKFWRHTSILIGISLFCIVLPFALIKTNIINGYVAGILTLAGLNALMALSVNMVCGITGQLSLGQACFEAIGAYATVLLWQKGVPLPVCMVFGAVSAAFFGFLIGFPTLKLEGDYLAIVTLAFGEITRVVLMNLKSVTNGPYGLNCTTFFTVDFSWGPSLSFVLVIASLILVITGIQNFVRSSYGRAILAVREDEIAANSNGISVFKYKMIGFVIAAFVAGIAGSLYAPIIGYFKPDLASFNNSINDLIFVVLGGMGSVTGSVLAAFVLTSLQEFLRFLGDFRILIYAVLLIIVMLFRPQGLLGMKEFSFIKTIDSFLPRKKESH